MALDEEVSVRDGAVLGAVPWVYGVVLTFLFGTLGATDTLSFIVAPSPLFGSLFGYFLFHTWFLPGGASEGLAVFTAIPVGLLLAAGFLAARRRGPNVRAAVAGASVTVGYFVLGAISVVAAVSALGGGGEAATLSVDADALVGILVAGVVFPLLFGTIGGAIADAV